MTTNPTDLATLLATMPILTADEIYRLPIGRRNAIRDREQLLAHLKHNANHAATAHDAMMHQLNTQGARARRRAEETKQVVADILATPVVPASDGESNFRRLEEAIRQDRSSNRDQMDRQSTDMARPPVGVAAGTEA